MSLSLATIKHRHRRDSFVTLPQGGPSRTDTAKEHVQRFGFQNLRVLTVTTSMERIQSMLAVVKAITEGKGHGMFLFTDVATLAKYSDPLTLPWITTNGTARIDVPPRS